MKEVDFNKFITTCYKEKKKLKAVKFIAEVTSLGLKKSKFWIDDNWHKENPYVNLSLILQQTVKNYSYSLPAVNFVPSTTEAEYICEECGSDDIEQQMWVNMNTNKLSDDPLVDENDKEVRCNKCERKTYYKENK